MNVSPEQIAELQLLAARAEASVDGSMASVRYTSVRSVQMPHYGVGIDPPFNMFALSIDGRDVMFCRTPEIAKFIVALLNFGGTIVAEHSEPKEPTLSERGWTL